MAKATDLCIWARISRNTLATCMLLAKLPYYYQPVILRYSILTTLRISGQTFQYTGKPLKNLFPQFSYFKMAMLADIPLCCILEIPNSISMTFLLVLQSCSWKLPTIFYSLKLCICLRISITPVFLFFTDIYNIVILLTYFQTLYIYIFFFIVLFIQVQI